MMHANPIAMRLLPPAGGALSLADRQMLDLPDADGLRILCTEGCLWVTIDHDPRDIVLRPGESFAGEGHVRALVYALQPSSMQIGG